MVVLVEAGSQEEEVVGLMIEEMTDFLEGEVAVETADGEVSVGGETLLETAKCFCWRQ